VLRTCVLAAVVAVAVGAGLASAETPGGPFLTGETSRTGYVNLFYLGEGGTRVDFFERAGEARAPLGAVTAGEDGLAVLFPATAWRCDRLVRSFESRAVAPDGTVRDDAFDIRTPSCRDRLRVRTVERARPRARVRVAVVDRWELGGLTARVCAVSPGGGRRCRALTLAESQRRAATRFRMAARGRWRVTVDLAGHRTVRHVAVGLSARTRRPLALPRLLTTGDSTIEGIESFLADGLAGRARVLREFHVGSGISKPEEPSWTDRALDQSRRYRQRVTVISIGAVDGFDFPGAACCDAAWRAEYARRVRRMLDAYGRDGAGRVLWLALPAARDERFAAIAAAVNAAVAEAVAGVPWARHVRLDEIFTPGGEFRTHMGDPPVKVRTSDGIHLTAAGTRIAARAVVRALRGWR
jgi:lysophospholipase L1-like esterase